MKKIITICLISILATGYASQGITSIKPEDRDRSGKFDGGWTGSVHIKRQAPRIEDRLLTCNDNKFSFSLYIDDGRITIPDLSRGDGYIKEDGTLYVNGKLEKIDIDRRLIVSGQLSGNKGEGKVVITYEHPTKGCKGTVNLIRVNMAPVKSPDTKKEQPVLDTLESGPNITGTYVSDIKGGPPDLFRTRNVKITFKQSGNDIIVTSTGSIGTNISRAGKEIIGTRKGDTIKFKYGRNMTGVWKINSDGTKLEGKWEFSGNTDSSRGTWNLTIIE